jgi:hypothetical protein
VIAADNTGVVIGSIEECPAYQISIKQKGRTDQYYGTFSVQENELEYNRLHLVQKLFALSTRI